jgi:hypothetical protein
MMEVDRSSTEYLEKCVEAENWEGFSDFLGTTEMRAATWLLVSLVYRALVRLKGKANGA